MRASIALLPLAYVARTRADCTNWASPVFSTCFDPKDCVAVAHRVPAANGSAAQLTCAEFCSAESRTCQRAGTTATGSCKFPRGPCDSHGGSPGDEYMVCQCSFELKSPSPPPQSPPPSPPTSPPSLPPPPATPPPPSPLVPVSPQCPPAQPLPSPPPSEPPIPPNPPPPASPPPTPPPPQDPPTGPPPPSLSPSSPPLPQPPPSPPPPPPFSPSPESLPSEPSLPTLPQGSRTSPPTQPQVQSGKSDNLSRGAVAGIFVASVLLPVLMGLAFYVLKLRPQWPKATYQPADVVTSSSTTASQRT